MEGYVSDVENLPAKRRCELADFICESVLNSILSREGHISHVQLSPSLVGQIEVLSEYRFYSGVINPNSFCDPLELGSLGGHLWPRNQVDLKGAYCGRLTVPSTQESDRAHGLHRSHIVDRQFERNGLEEVVKRDTIGHESAGGLEQQMDVPDPIVASYSDSVKDSLDGSLVNLVGKSAVDLWWEFGNLSGHFDTLSRSSR